MLRYIKAMMIFARFQAWVESAGWEKQDAEVLTQFLQSRTGRRLSAALVNMTLRQQASALAKTSGLEFEAGYCNGQRSVLSAMEALADVNQFTAEEIQDSDLQTSP